jgi:hypothetical protein
MKKATMPAGELHGIYVFHMPVSVVHAAPEIGRISD